MLWPLYILAFVLIAFIFVGLYFGGFMHTASGDMTAKQKKESVKELRKDRTIYGFTGALTDNVPQGSSWWDYRTKSISNAEIIIKEKGIIIMPFISTYFGVFFDEVTNIVIEDTKLKFVYPYTITLYTINPNRPKIAIGCENEVEFLEVLSRVWDGPIERLHEDNKEKEVD